MADLITAESLYRDSFRFGLVGSLRGTSEQGRLSLSVLGETPERVEQRARALLTLVDRGFLAPTLREFTPVLSGVVKEAETRLVKARAQLPEAKAKLAEAEKQLEALKPFQDVTPETLPNFISQQRMIAVDMAGVRAKTAACEKLLKDESLSRGRREQVETAKIMAEIELVGLTAKHASLEEIVREGRKRIDLTSEVKRLRERASSDAGYVAGLENIQKSLTAAMVPENFFGQVVDTSALREGGLEAEKLRGKILIRPIRWTARER